MTKYEYIHNRNHEKKYLRKGEFYTTPVERIVIIILIYLLLIVTPLLFIFTKYYWGLLSILGIIWLFMWSQYNIFYSLERFEYFFYYLFGKNNIYKEFIIKLSQYENVVKYENLMGFKLRKSYYNCRKIVFKSNKYQGYICMKYICINGRKKDYDISNFVSIKEYVSYIKSLK